MFKQEDCAEDMHNRCIHRNVDLQALYVVNSVAHNNNGEYASTCMVQTALHSVPNSSSGLMAYWCEMLCRLVAQKMFYVFLEIGR